jgi:hypothetical protein
MAGVSITLHASCSQLNKITAFQLLSLPSPQQYLLFLLNLSTGLLAASLPTLKLNDMKHTTFQFSSLVYLDGFLKYINSDEWDISVMRLTLSCLCSGKEVQTAQTDFGAVVI